MRGLIVTCLLVSISHILPGQQQSRGQQIDSLKTALNHANDTTTSLIYLELSKRMIMDSASNAMNYARKAKAHAIQVEYQNGLALYYSLMAEYDLILFHEVPRSKLFLDSARSKNINSFAARPVNAALATYYTLTGQDDKSYEASMNALAMNGSQLDRTTMSIYNMLGLSAERMGRMKDAKKYFRLKYTSSESLGLAAMMGAALQNLATVYGIEGKTDSTLLILQELYQLELEHGNPKDNVLLLSNLGSVYQDKGKLDTAYYFLKEAQAAAHRVNLAEGYGGIYNALARYHVDTQPDSARWYSWKAKPFTLGVTRELEKTLLYLSKAHQNLNRMDSAYYYLDQYLIIHDSVLSENRTWQVNELEAIYQTSIKDAQIQQLSAQQKADRLTTTLLTIGIIGSTIIGVLIYYFYRMKLSAKKREIESKNIQLRNYLKNMLEKSALVEELKAQLGKLHEQTGNNVQIEYLSAMLHASLLTEDDWIEFRTIFEKVHPAFFAILRSTYPDLTTSEIRLSALVKLNLQTREMANMLGISADSVGKARKRLRKSLNLSPDQDLRQFIDSLTRSRAMAA